VPADQADLDPTGCRSSAPSGSSAARSEARRLFPLRLIAAIREATEEILERPDPERRERSCPRAVKRARFNHYHVKRQDQKNITHSSPPTICLIHPPLN